MPDLSIIMPVYNGGAYLKDSIGSILNTIKNVSWELMLCNDGSTDDTENLISPFLSDERIRYVKHEQNRGVCSTRNELIGLSTADILLVLDCDNILQDGMVDKMYVMLNQDVLVVCTEKIQFFGYGGNTSLTVGGMWDFSRFGGMVGLQQMICGSGDVPPSSGNYMFKKIVFNAVGGYHREDVQETWGFGFRHIAAGYPIHICPGTAYYHRFCRKGLYLSLSKEAMTRAAYDMIHRVKNKLTDDSQQVLEEYAQSRDGNKMVESGRLRAK